MLLETGLDVAHCMASPLSLARRLEAAATETGLVGCTRPEPDLVKRWEKGLRPSAASCCSPGTSAGLALGPRADVDALCCCKGLPACDGMRLRLFPLLDWAASALDGSKRRRLRLR